MTKTEKIVFDIINLNLFYGETQALKNIEFPIYEKEVTALIGPSGCGKSTFLRTLNRMNDLVVHVSFLVMFHTMKKTFIRPVWMLSVSEKELIWYFKNQTLFR